MLFSNSHDARRCRWRLGTGRKLSTDTDITEDSVEIGSAADRGAFAKRVGGRLREIRRQQGLSLHDVESRSAKEFKASVLGAYERGERSISVPRLSRLADFYSVSVDQLLPGGDGATRGKDVRGSSESIAIDLRELRRNVSADMAVLERYLTRIQLERQDFNGKVLTVRRDDLRTIGHLLDLDLDEFVERLGEMGLLAEVGT